MGCIRYSVSMRAQGPSPICWVACAEMILSFKRGEAPSSDMVTVGGASAANSSIPNPLESRRRLREMGFVCEDPNFTPAASYIEDLLRNHGPWMLHHYAADLLPVRGTETHAMVVTGIDTARDKVWFNNPWGRVDEDRSINAVLTAISHHIEAGYWTVAYIR